MNASPMRQVMRYYDCSFDELVGKLTAEPFDLAKVDKRTKRVDGVDFLTINPKGYVPALQLDDGQVLTENVAVLQVVGAVKIAGAIHS